MKTSNQGLPVRGEMVPVEGLGFHETPRQLRKKVFKKQPNQKCSFSLQKLTCMSWVFIGLLIVIAAASTIIWTTLPGINTISDTGQICNYTDQQLLALLRPIYSVIEYF